MCGILLHLHLKGPLGAHPKQGVVGRFLMKEMGYVEKNPFYLYETSFAEVWEEASNDSHEPRHSFPREL